MITGQNAEKTHAVTINPAFVESHEYDTKKGTLWVNLASGRQHQLTGSQAQEVYNGLTSGQAAAGGALATREGDPRGGQGGPPGGGQGK